jgi:hypothetical protein
MGQQQLLLLVLSVIIVGIAIVVGISMFNSQAASSNLDGVSADLMHFGTRAQQYFARPVAMGGGGGSFTGMPGAVIWATPGTTYTNENGTYIVSVTTTIATFTGTGKRDGDRNGTNCQAQAVVTRDTSCVLTVTGY